MRAMLSGAALQLWSDEQNLVKQFPSDKGKVATGHQAKYGLHEPLLIGPCPASTKEVKKGNKSQERVYMRMEYEIQGTDVVC